MECRQEVSQGRNVAKGYVFHDVDQFLDSTLVVSYLPIS